MLAIGEGNESICAAVQREHMMIVVSFQSEVKIVLLDNPNILFITKSDEFLNPLLADIMLDFLSSKGYPTSLDSLLQGKIQKMRVYNNGCY